MSGSDIPTDAGAGGVASAIGGGSGRGGRRPRGEAAPVRAHTAQSSQSSSRLNYVCIRVNTYPDGL